MKTNDTLADISLCSISGGEIRFLNIPLTFLFIFLSLFHTPAFAEQRLDAGDWKGSFFSHDGTRYKIAYKVGYSEDDEIEAIKIRMIYLDLEPRSKFTFALSDIEIGSDHLKFKIVKEFETKQCKLKYKNSQYSGTCTSNVGEADEFSKITMIPPPKATAAETDAEAEIGTDSNKQVSDSAKGKKGR